MARDRSQSSPGDRGCSEKFSNEPILLVSKRVDWIEPRCFAGRVEAEEDTDAAGDEEGDDDRARADHDGPAGGLADEYRRADTEKDAGESADDRERDRFEEKLKENMPALGSDG